MKIIKVSLGIVFSLGLVFFLFLIVVNNGHLDKFAISTKDLTFGVRLNTIPTKTIKKGLTTYIVYDEDSIDAADKKILNWFEKSVESKG